MIRKQITIIAIILTIALCSSVTGWSDTSHHIELNTTLEIEVDNVDDKGRCTKKRIPAETVVPGTEIICTIAYHNTADQNTVQAVITSPIPEQIRYQSQSAFGEKTRVTFSVDDGQSFELPQNLYKADASGRRFPAQPDDYTHIRWELQDTIPALASGQVGFRAILK
jgi:hypothetical protein